jgi:nuclear GTP-binding protein
MKRRLMGSAEEDNANEIHKNEQVLLNASLNQQESIEEEDIEEDVPTLVDGNVKLLTQNSRRAYLSELRKVIQRADVIIQVLDARDPLGTKSTVVEDMVLANHRKRLVYVLNKSDLVPREVLENWLKYLRCSHPTIPFKCNTQNQKSHLGTQVGKVLKQQSEELLQSSQAIGSEELLNLLKNYCRVSFGGEGGSGKNMITVGIVGFPNVGKSSLINSLMRIRAVGVSAVPGFTKSLQEVILDKNIRLIDSPGVVFADGDTAATALRNCVNVEDMEDVMTPVQAILDKCPAGYLMQLYAIPKFPAKDAQSFLAAVAKSIGKLKKGGIPNVDAAARTVLHDWNQGKIKFYCKPPAAADRTLHHDEISSFKNETQLISTVNGVTTTAFIQKPDAVDEEMNLETEDMNILNSLQAHTKDSVFIPMNL